MRRESVRGWGGGVATKRVGEGFGAGKGTWGGGACSLIVRVFGASYGQGVAGNHKLLRPLDQDRSPPITL
jgi:hypothetical protein